MGTDKTAAFVKERNEALFSFDKAKIIAYCKKYGVHFPENDVLFWAGVCKAICNITNAPENVRKRASDWLNETAKQNLCDESQALRLAASQQAQNNYFVQPLRPCPSPAYIVSSLYCRNNTEYEHLVRRSKSCTIE